MRRRHDPAEPSSPILPTLKCFDDAFDFFGEFFPRGRGLLNAAEDYRIVHGLLLGNDEGKPYAHAWVEQTRDAYAEAFKRRPKERGPIVWQAGTLEGMRVWYTLQQHDFDHGYNVQRRYVYTLQEAIEQNMRTGYLGPWHPDLVELAARQGEGRILGHATCGRPLSIVHLGRPA